MHSYRGWSPGWRKVWFTTDFWEPCGSYKDLWSILWFGSKFRHDISDHFPLKNQGFKPGGSRTCIWPSFRPMFCRCSAGGKKPDAKNDHFDGSRPQKWSKQNLQLRTVWTISLWRANQHWSILCWIWRGIRFRQNKSSITGRKKAQDYYLYICNLMSEIGNSSKRYAGDMRPTLRQLDFDHSPKLFPRLRTKLSWSLAWRSPDPYLQERRPRRIYKRDPRFGSKFRFQIKAFWGGAFPLAVSSMPSMPDLFTSRCQKT